jgi:hypothetical protein
MLWTGCLRNWGSVFSSAKRLLLHSVHAGSCDHQVSYSVGIRDPFPGMKEHVHRANHLLPPIAKIKNVWYYISIPLYFFIILCFMEQLYILLCS